MREINLGESNEIFIKNEENNYFNGNILFIWFF